MPTVFKNQVVNSIGTTPVDVLQIPEGVRATVVGCNLSNLSDFVTVIVNVYVIDENSTQGSYLRSVPIPPGSSAKVVQNGERLILPATAGLRINSDTEDSVDATISYVEIS